MLLPIMQPMITCSLATIFLSAVKQQEELIVNHIAFMSCSVNTCFGAMSPMTSTVMSLCGYSPNFLAVSFCLERLLQLHVCLLSCCCWHAITVIKIQHPNMDTGLDHLLPLHSHPMLHTPFGSNKVTHKGLFVNLTS